MVPRPKKPRGRPPKYPMPEPLDVDMDTLSERRRCAPAEDITERGGNSSSG